jgi:beta-N-acetylhexosaminidase
VIVSAASFVFRRAASALWLLPVLLLLGTLVAGARAPAGTFGGMAVAPSAGVAPNPSVLPGFLQELQPADSAWVERTLAGMSLRQRVAQLVFPWVPGQAAVAHSAEYQRMLRWVAEDEVGGLIVSRGPPGAVASRLNAAQARSRVPLLVLSDLETGPAMRLSPGGTYFPPAMAFGAAGSTELAREAGRITGREARAVGIHLTLGPVLDVNSNPLNPIINVRSFGEDPEVVAALSAAWAAGAREVGLLTAGKHFPGHGDTDVDSHVGLPTIRGGPERLDAVELRPFERSIAAGMDGVLVGHIAVASLDGPNAGPASLSPRIIGELLRERLGFRGLVITDALNMGAITRNLPVAEASIQALLAGADLLLQPPGTTEVVDRIVEAVEAGRLSRDRVDEAARRILQAKASVGLHRAEAGGRVNAGAVASTVGNPEHRAAADRLAGASITLVRDGTGLVPLPPRMRRILHVVHPGPGGASVGAGITRELRADGRVVDEARVGARLTPAEREALRRRAVAADLVVATALVAPREYRALEMDAAFARFVEEVAATKPVVAISLGSPYLLDSFPSVPAYLLAWSPSPAGQRAAARALLGTAPITGRLPVSLPPDYLAGHGLARFFTE